MSKVEFVTVDRYSRILINGLIHLQFSNCVEGIHSYIDSEFINPRPSVDGGGPFITRYFIEFYLSSGQTVKAEYDNRKLWEEILKGL